MSSSSWIVLVAALLLLGAAGPVASVSSSSRAELPLVQQPAQEGNGSRSWLQSAWEWLRQSVLAPRLRPGASVDDPLPGSGQQASEKDQEDGPVGTVQWAVLIAGSSGWWNYRHQADVLHSYQVLRGGGLHPDRIVLMVYDDLARNPQNPYLGQIFNRPGGPDVYAGAEIDYKGNDVNAETFLAVLQGNRTAVAGIGTGKVVASGPDDHVFVFFSDHGAPGVLGMPSGNFLFANDLMAALRHKHATHGYREMTLYIEACESGSIFEGLLGPELSIYATTAANAEESSWGTYCPGMDIPPDLTGLDTCLGDLYSVAWMEDTECEDTTTETLKDQFELVRLRTSHNDTYNMGSHVMQYGRIAIQQETVSDYLGPRDASACMLPNSEAAADITPAGVREPQQAARLLLRSKAHRQAHGASSCPRGKRCNALHAKAHAAHVAQREADLVPLRVRAARGKTHAQRQQAQAELDAEVSRRQQVDSGLEAATAQLLLLRGASQALMSSLGWHQDAVFRTSSVDQQHTGENRLVPGARYVQQLLTSSTLLGRGPGSGKALVDDWDCLKGMVAAYSSACPGAMDQYVMRHTRLFANLCNAGVRPGHLEEALRLTHACPTRAAADGSSSVNGALAAAE